MAGNQYYVEPANLGGLLAGVGSVLESTRKRKMQQTLMDAYQSRDPNQVAKVMAKNPEAGKQLESMMDFRDKQSKRVFLETTRNALSSPDNAVEYLQGRVEYLEGRGMDTTNAVKALDIYQQDPEAAKNVMEMTYAQLAPKQEWEAYKDQKTIGKGADLKVGAQEILEDGTIIQSTNTGPVVYNPEGKRVKGKFAADAVQIARAQKVSNLRKAAGQKRLATLEAEGELKGKVEAGIVSMKDAAKISTKAFEKLDKINLNISNMDEAIQAIDDGASTGVVASRMPSIRAASQRLDNLQKRLGLDVVGQTTFGALSKGELDLALSSALPTNMQPNELRSWLVAKKDAMEKLSDYVEASAIYLGTPGNTVKGWVEYQRGKNKNKNQSKIEVENNQPQQFQEGMTATNPQTGQQMVFTNGQWQ